MKKVFPGQPPRGMSIVVMGGFAVEGARGSQWKNSRARYLLKGDFIVVRGIDSRFGALESQRLNSRCWPRF